MNEEQFKKKAEELFKKYSYEGVHGGDLVIGENAFDYLIEQLHEALTIPVVVVSACDNYISINDDYRTCKNCGKTKIQH